MPNGGARVAARAMPKKKAAVAAKRAKAKASNLPKTEPPKNPAKPAKAAEKKPCQALDMRKAYQAEIKALRAQVKKRTAGQVKELAVLQKEIAARELQKKRIESATGKEVAALEKRIAVLEGRNS